jgi:hypothetical protein
MVSKGRVCVIKLGLRAQNLKTNTLGSIVNIIGEEGKERGAYMTIQRSQEYHSLY